MMLKRLISAILFAIALICAPLAVSAQDSADAPRAETGGAQTLEDILARQRGEAVDDDFRRNATGSADAAAALTGQLGTLGGASDAEVFRALRYGSADTTVSARGPTTGLLIQDGGMKWLKFREGPLLQYGGYLLLGMLGALCLFYLMRGKIRIDGTKNGLKILRFNGVERFAHWLLAGSFILLGLTGLLTLMGRLFLIPLIGKEAYATMALGGKWVHNNVAWAFMLGLIMVFLFWVIHNIPNKTDLKWLAKGGGLFSKGVHPPAKKFNAGQKVIFWAVIVLGASISLSGLSLLFPFELPMFAKTFALLNATGLPQLLGYGALPETLSPYQEIQYSQMWHGIVAFVFMAIIIAHIYLGSVGMEGAFDAMGSGEVEEQWAKEHHSLWYDEVSNATPTAPAPEQAPAE